MLPLRPHLSIATAALVFVLPVVAGVIIGGFPAGVASVAAGFLVYDFVFIPPYGSLSVGSSQDWVALVVYVGGDAAGGPGRRPTSTSARTEAQSRTAEARRLFELSELLVEDRSVDELLRPSCARCGRSSRSRGWPCWCPSGDRLEIAASAGEELSPDELQRLDPQSGRAGEPGHRAGGAR